MLCQIGLSHDSMLRTEQDATNNSLCQIHFLGFDDCIFLYSPQILGFNSAAHALPVVDQLKDSDENTILSIAGIFCLWLIFTIFLVVYTFYL